MPPSSSKRDPDLRARLAMRHEDIRARNGEDGENGVHNEGTKKTETNEGSLLVHTCHGEFRAERGKHASKTNKEAAARLPALARRASRWARDPQIQAT